jgi:hypothetical protein
MQTIESEALQPSQIEGILIEVVLNSSISFFALMQMGLYSWL